MPPKPRKRPTLPAQASDRAREAVAKAGAQAPRGAKKQAEMRKKKGRRG